MMDLDILLFAAIGFFAQLIDGALGMAFGIIASMSLIATGAPPAIASAAVHAAEIVTTGVSAASHIWNRNIDRKLFLRLVLTGAAGGAVGAYVLTGLPEQVVKPIVTVYLACMAVLIFMRVLGRKQKRWRPPTPVIGAIGGFLDAIGGGGFGPLTTSTLVAAGDPPRPVVGSVNLAEFFIAITVSVTFLTQLDLERYGRLVLGLVIGGALAAPMAGYLLRVMSTRVALLLVGAIVAGLSLLNLVQLFI
jgi:uncharacterized protein